MSINYLKRINHRTAWRRRYSTHRWM